MPNVQVVGVYPVDAPEPCHLVELRVSGSEGRFDVSQFTQEDDRPRIDWQVAYAEKLLDASGDSIEWALWNGPGDEVPWSGDLRLAFFFHYLDFARPLRTPFGPVDLPAPSPLPDRLAHVEYEEP